MSDIKIFTIKCKRGIDDLQSIYAFRGNSQGDDSGTNKVDDYGGWKSFVFDDSIDPTDQEAINAESLRRVAANAEYIEQLHKEGKYGEEYEITIDMQYNPIYDDPSLLPDDAAKGLEGYGVVFLDFNNDNKQIKQ